jgi:hypothetical protein
MGNHIKRFILAPSVQRDAVMALAVRLREEQRRPTTLTFCSLEDKQPRLEHARLAKQVNVRKVEVESALLPAVLIPAADAELGAGNFLFREKDDENLAVCHPNALWLRNTFGADGLEWLIDNFFEDHTSWGTERFYALPGNPPNCDVTLPIHVNMLRPARRGEPRACPICAQVYVSRFPRAQCRNTDCHFSYIPFESARDAYRIVAAKVGNTGWGSCPRCKKSRTFAAIVEQCQKCGQVIEATNASFKVDMKDNRTAAYSLMEELQRQAG